jgi:hypothetical protein
VSRDWIQTRTGKRFYPANPDPATIDIQDIAHALSNICRYTGHCREFYSVAEHSVRVSNLLRPNRRAALAGLLHDASEAYLADIATPVKTLPAFAEYREIEARLQRVIFSRFGLNPLAIPPSVKQADYAMFVVEARTLMQPDPGWVVWEDQPLLFNPAPPTLPMTPRGARAWFLTMFSELTPSGD